MTRCGRLLPWLLILPMLLLACSPRGASTGTRSGETRPGAQSDGRRGTVINVAVSGNVPNMGLMGLASTTTGGWFSMVEVHSNGLITSEEHSRLPVGRLIERVPTLDNQDITLLPDGRM